jgi:hypothetical protein
MENSNVTSFIGYANNAMIKFQIYFTLHIYIVDKSLSENALALLCYY